MNMGCRDCLIIITILHSVPLFATLTKHNQVDVKLSCGTIESLASVEEPSTCHYLMTLEAPVFCQSKNLLVYPILQDADKARWDRAFTEWQVCEFGTSKMTRVDCLRGNKAACSVKICSRSVTEIGVLTT